MPITSFTTLPSPICRWRRSLDCPGGASLSARQAGLRRRPIAGTGAAPLYNRWPMATRIRRRRRKPHASALAQDRDPARPHRRHRRRRRRHRRFLGAQRLQLGAAALEPEAGPEGPLLGDLRRRRQPDRLHPLRQHPPAGLRQGAAADAQGRDGRDRGQELLQPRRARPRRHRPRRLEGPLAGGKPVQGASTITQQLVRNLYIQNPEETLKRKLIEAHLANDLFEKHARDWILTPYLNTAPYGTVEGQTAVGAEAAAQTYFGKPAKDLNLTEAALIAGLPQAPSEYNPFLDPAAATQRRNEVLGTMEEQGYITTAEYSEAIDQAASASTRRQVPGDPRPLPLRPGPAGADRALRDQHRPQRRPQGLHDDQPEPAGGRRGGGRQRLLRLLPGGGPAAGLASVNPETGEIVALASTQGYAGEDSSTTPGRPTASPAPRSRPSS